MTPQNVEKAVAHALRRDDILARAQLLHLGAHDLGDTRPACESDDERDAPRARRADDCLQEDDKQQVRHAEKNFGQAHQQRVEPFGRKAADRAEEDREQRRNDGRADADEQRQPPTVPDHREDVAPHRVRAEQELAARHGRAVSQVEIHRVLRHDNTPKLSQTEKDDITMKENRKLLREVLKDIRRDMTDEEVLNLLADSKISENPAGEQEKYTLGQRAADAIAKFAGSWAFIFSFTGVLILWMLVNTLLAAKAFDPYPFILLDLVLSCVAAIQAPLIMMSQNRQEEKDRRRAENDYKVNLKTEIMIEDLYDKVNAILARQTALEKQLTEKGESAGQK